MKRRHEPVAVAARGPAQEPPRGPGTPSPPAGGCRPSSNGAPPPPGRGADTPWAETGSSTEAMPMTERGQRICRLADEAARTHDPESALRILTELRREL